MNYVHIFSDIDSDEDVDDDDYQTMENAVVKSAIQPNTKGIGCSFGKEMNGT